MLTSLRNNCLLVTWAKLDSGETGEWVELSSWPLKTVQISGDTVTTVVLQGSNEPAGANPQTLYDVDNTTLINKAGLFVLKGNPRFIRPVCGTGLQVQVTMLCSNKLLNAR